MDSIDTPIFVVTDGIVEDNPFNILEVTPNDTIEVINEASEDKAFTDEDNEQFYDNARQVLINPAKRLNAEVRWFYDLEVNIRYEDEFVDIEIPDLVNWLTDRYPFFSNERHFVREEKLLDNPRENIIVNIVRLPFVPKDFIASYIIELDRNYAEACENDQIYDLIDNINISRRKAKIPLCKDFNAVKNEVKSIIADIERALNRLFKEKEDEVILKFTNEVAANTIEKGYKYGRVIEKLIDLYQGKFQELLKSYKDKILEEIEVCKEEYSEEEELDYLCKLTRYFDYIAQPLQLLFKDRGQYKEQEESVEVATAIRNLAIYYHNEEQATELSIKLINLELELFSELPDLYKEIEEDKRLLSELQGERNYTNAINDEFDELEKVIVHDDKSAQRNKQFLQSKYNKLKDLIFKFSYYVMNNPSPDKQRSEYQTLMVALYYRTLGVNCTWADMWTEAKECYESSLYWAKRTNNQDLINQINSSLNNIKSNILQEQREKQQAKREAAEMRAINYESEWGLVFKNRVKLSQFGFEYNNKMIPLSAIKNVSWGMIKKQTKQGSIPLGTDYCINVGSDDKTFYIETNKQIYTELTDKLWKAVAPQIIKNILIALKKGQDAGFGEELQDTGIHYKEKKWFSKDIDIFYTWNEIRISHGNGTLDFINWKNEVLAYYSYISTYNVHMLEVIVNLAKRKGLKRLSDLL